MAIDRFTDQMQAYGRWREDLVAAIDRYRNFLEDNQLSDPETELRIFELVDALRSDHLTIAFVAEFARGKTELINATFFSEYDRRLLPSEAGRTTMCPTELFYDGEADQAYIRLLPIESRLDEQSVGELKKNPIHWTTIELDTNSSEKMANAFQEVIKTKQVTVATAQKLGLVEPETPEDPNAHVEIPMWRHALISFPHPLLKQGLTILDTPGLNALGNEPELTLNMLPNAQAVIFVLAADTGVTKSDLTMWQHHVQALEGDHAKSRIVVLNKIDTLWDELKSDDAVSKSIATQCNNAAQMLNIAVDNVLPISAQKGLLAKIRHDERLLEHSNILALEAVLSTEILPHKQRIVRDDIVTEIGAMAKSSRNLISGRLQDAQKQIGELQSLSGKNEDVIGHLMRKTREEQVSYHKAVESFQSNKRIFGEQHKKLLSLLSLAELDKLVTKTRRDMSDSWTTPGLKAGMKTFFEGITENMRQAHLAVDQVNTLVQTIYRRFHQEHNLAQVKPKLLALTKHRRELERLYHEAEAYRRSPVTTMTEQGFVIKRFFISLVSHARNVYFNASHDAEAWGKAVMAPLVAQIKEQKSQIEKRLDSLRKINESRDTLQSKLDELTKASEQLKGQLADIDALLETINAPLDSFVDQGREQMPDARAAG